MRSVPDRPALKILASRDVRRPVYSINVRDDVLHFADGATDTLHTTMPHVSTSIRVCDLKVGRLTCFTGHVSNITYLNQFDYAAPDIDQAHAVINVSNGSMKADITYNEFVVGVQTGGHVAINRYNLSFLTLNSTTAIVPLTCSFSSTLVKRMESVHDLDGTNTLMVWGIHDITNLLSTLQFWIVSPTSSRQLDTVIQIPMGTALTNNIPDWSAWDTGAQYCTNTDVVNNGNGYTVVCNDTSTGRAIQFKISPAGIESQHSQVIQIDVDATTTTATTLNAVSIQTFTFMPVGLAKIGSLYYLSGMITRPMTDGTIDIYCVYLTSADAWNWSVGERSFFVASTATKGQIVPFPSAPTAIVYAGLSPSGFTVFTAAARVIDGNGTAVDITNKMVQWSLDENTDSADSMNIDFLPGTPVTEGSTVNFGAGWMKDDGTPYVVTMGDYISDMVPNVVTPDGPQNPQIGLLERSGRITNDWKASVDVSQYSRTNHEDPLNALDKMIIKTIIRDVAVKSQSDPNNILKAVTINDGALYSTSLNDPTIGYSTERDDRDGMLYGEIEFATTDPGCQQSFGFVFGASSTQFNAVVIPKTSSWTGHRFDNVGPMVVTSNLAPEDSTLGTGGWNTPFRLTGLMESILADPYGVMTTPVQTVNDAAFRPVGSWSFANGHKYQVAARKAGRRLQVYSKIMDYTPANCATNASWTMIAEFLLDETVRHAWDDRPYSGVALSTDVWVSQQAFAEAEYGDIDSSLTSAGELGWSPSSIIGTCTHYGRPKLTGGPRPFGGNYDDLRTLTLQGTTWPVGFTAGTAVYLVGLHTSMFATVTDILAFPNFRVPSFTYEMHWDQASQSYTNGGTGWVEGETIHIYGPGITQDWGFATSGYSTTSLSAISVPGTSNPAATVVNDGGVVKRTGQGRGKAFIVNDGSDSTAEETRYVRTDGAKHILMSGTGPTGSAWNTTSPIGNPGVWSIKMKPSVVIQDLSTNYGLPASGYFKADDEIMRYGNETFQMRGTIGVNGAYQYNNWCMVPTYYYVLKSALAGTTQIKQWLDPTIHIPYTQGMAEIINPHGLLLTFKSRSNDTNAVDTSTIKFYLDYLTLIPSGTMSYDTTHILNLLSSYPDGTINPPAGYPNDITEPRSGGAADILIVSGRAQCGTDEALHDATTPVLFYPKVLTVPADTSPLSWLIRMDSFDQYQGLYNSIEDDLKYTSALAGIRNTHFRSLGSYTGNLTNSPVTLYSNVSNFVLDIKAHLFGNTDNRLRLTFRNGQYILDLQNYIDSTRLANGRVGDLRYMLQAPLSPIVQGAFEAKWLDQNIVTVASTDISGTYNSGVHVENTALQVSMRVIVRDNIIVIETEGQHTWTMNLDHFNYVDTAVPPVTHSLKYTDYGPVTIQYTAATSVPVTARLLELSPEIEAHIIDMGSSLGDAVGFLLEGRHIWSRAHEDGGILYTTNMVREDWSSDAVDLIENVTQDEQIDSNLQVASHIITSGAEFGEYLDPAWIRTYGYSFEMGQNRLLNTVQDSRDESRIILRTTKEHSTQRTFTGPGIMDIQPLDRLTVSRPATGDIPATASDGYVVASKHTTGDIDSITGTLVMFVEQTL